MDQRGMRGRGGAPVVAVAAAVALLAGCTWDEGVVTATGDTTTTAPPAPADPATGEAPPAPGEGAGEGEGAAPGDEGGAPGGGEAPATTTTTRPPAGSRTHTIQPGDNLYQLAQQYGVSVEAIAAANADLDPQALTVGATLVIPPADQR